MKIFGLTFTVFVLVGCAAQVPVPVSKTPVANVSVGEVRADATRFTDTKVRWGGTIARVENKATETWVEIVSRQLRSSGQPREAGGSSGRFIASFKGFFDPVVYKKGLQLTVLGTIKGEIKRPIGEHEYTFPLVTVSASHLWPEIQDQYYYDYPPSWWYYDPWPYYRWPYFPYY